MTIVAPAPSGLSETRAELGPVREALFADAKFEADRLIADATSAAASEAEEAEREADAEIERAARRGAASARARANQELARARNIAHHQTLQAKDDIRGRFHDAVQVAALDLRNDARYPALLNELEGLARDQLGPNTRIERDPNGLGGIVGVSGARRVDYTLPALADRALESVSDKVALLWM
jgi:vacuolar-type H+-ATPase subunit E/Vma4